MGTWCLSQPFLLHVSFSGECYTRKHKENLCFNKLSLVNGTTSYHLLKPWHLFFFASSSNISACPASQYVQPLTTALHLQCHPLPWPPCTLACKAVAAPFLLPVLLPTIYIHIVAKLMFFETKSHHVISVLETFK